MRGVSGGERKRVSIAEVALAGAPFGCWDNSTRGRWPFSALSLDLFADKRFPLGLDSANAIEFCKVRFSFLVKLSNVLTPLPDFATVLRDLRFLECGGYLSEPSKRV